MTQKENWQATNRLGGLRRFAIAITAFNILGHAVFGFEQSWATPFVSVGTAYFFEIVFELLDCYIHGHKPRFAGGWRNLVDFLLSAHITGLAVGMLLYANARLMPVVFAAAVAITSKALFRVTVQERSRHFLNPSNFGIATTLLLFPSVGIAAPYHFTENLSHWGSWILPAFIVCSGSFLNIKFTRRIFVALGWVTGFFAQAVFRHYAFGNSLTGALLPLSGVTLVLFTFYMVTDPATTPCMPRGQFVFGASVAAAYGLLVSLHIVFGFFFALTAVSLVRGVTLYAQSYLKNTADQGIAAQAALVLAREMA
jgi:Na+-translocating ferredoxin:NAD+ oxidoreductase RnfD subunit